MKCLGAGKGFRHPEYLARRGTMAQRGIDGWSAELRIPHPRLRFKDDAMQAKVSRLFR